MAEVFVSSVIRTSIDRVWAVVRDFNAMPSWHPLIARSRIETGAPSDQISCVRNFYLTDGAHIREELTALSDEDFSFGYKILDSDLPLENYKASLSLLPVTDANHTLGVWRATFKCSPELENELIETVGQGVFQAGFDALNSRF
jgi:hypothetical protein